MKKYLLILAVAALPLSVQTAKAQATYPVISVKEDDFEVWLDDPANPAIRDPDSGTFNHPCWETLNPLSGFVLGGSPQSVFKDSTAGEVHSGNYSCRIMSVVLTSSSYNYVKSFVPHDTVGVVLAATLTSNPSIKPGAPFKHRIYTFDFWYQYAPQMNNGKPDTASCTVVLTHHTSQTNVLGSGALKMNAAAGWTQGIVPITYDSLTGNPDTIQVIFSSSSEFKPAPGSKLIIDGVTPLFVNEVVAGEKASVNVYPNPASSEVNFRITGDNARNLKIYDVTGKEVNTYTVKDNMLTVNTSYLATGLYIYQLYDRNGALMNVGKFSVEK